MKINTTFTLSFASCALALCLATFVMAATGNTQVVESFDYDPGPQKPFYIAGEGWDQERPAWSVWAGDDLEPDIITEGSLTYTDSAGKALPTAGNRLEAKQSVLLRKLIDVFHPGFEGAVLMDIAGDEKDERSVPGFGKGGGTIWFSFLIRPDLNAESGFDIRLTSSVYNQEGAGVSFYFNQKKNELEVGQGWTGPLRNVTKATIPDLVPGETSWVVARLDFGPSWGSPDDEKILDIRKPETLEKRSEADGTLIVWINPPLGAVPEDGMAAATCQMLEFRFNQVYMGIRSGVAVDEIRLGPTFESLVAK